MEELLRFAPPLETSTERYALEDFVFCGEWIHRGEMVLASIVSANRDRVVFDEADRLDLTRSLNPHLSFGQGAHHCLGARLARSEVRAAFEALFRHSEQLEPAWAPAELRWKRGATTRGLRGLPVKVR